MSVTFHSAREKVYNKICSFVALYPDFCISAVNLKLSITEMPIDSDFPRQRYFFLTYNATGTLRKETKPEHLPPFEGIFHDLPQREREGEREGERERERERERELLA